MVYEINFSKYVNERYNDHWCWRQIEADSEENAIKKLLKSQNVDGKKVNYILSIGEVK